MANVNNSNISMAASGIYRSVVYLLIGSSITLNDNVGGQSDTTYPPPSPPFNTLQCLEKERKKTVKLYSEQTKVIE